MRNYHGYNERKQKHLTLEDRVIIETGLNAGSSMRAIALQLGKGGDPVEALLTSSVSRFRPVMMASLTTILGMIPLLTDDFFGSIAVTIMGGLFIGTIITLLFIPILYAVFFKIKVK